MTYKDQQRIELARQVAEALEKRPDATVLYVSQPPPAKKKWFKRPTPMDVAYRDELSKLARAHRPELESSTDS